MVAHFFTYDSYYAPYRRRYSDGGAVSPGWVAFVAIVAVAAGALAYFRPRAGAAVTCLVLLLILVVDGLHRRALATAAATSSSSSSRSVRQSSSRRPSRTTPTTGGSFGAQRRGERLLERAREARDLGERQRAAAEARDRLLDLAARRARASRSARARTASAGSLEHPQHRTRAARRSR